MSCGRDSRVLSAHEMDFCRLIKLETTLIITELTRIVLYFFIYLLLDFQPDIICKL